MSERSRYPAISLPEAVSRLEKIYEQEGPSAMSSSVAVQHMGYSGLNGASMGVLAALKKYGLLEGRGEDIRVSQTGVHIISDKASQDPADRAARAEALRSALTSDSVFRELNERFKGRTTEINVASYLQKKGFKPAAAKSAAKSYIESSAFVELEGGGYNTISATQPEAQPVEQRNHSRTITPGAGALQVYETSAEYREAPIVISGVEQWPTIRLPKQFTEKNWADMMAILSAMRAGLVTQDTDKSSSGSGLELGVKDTKSL